MTARETALDSGLFAFFTGVGQGVVREKVVRPVRVLPEADRVLDILALEFDYHDFAGYPHSREGR